MGRAGGARTPRPGHWVPGAAVLGGVLEARSPRAGLGRGVRGLGDSGQGQPWARRVFTRAPEAGAVHAARVTIRADKRLIAGNDTNHRPLSPTAGLSVNVGPLLTL